MRKIAALFVSVAFISAPVAAQIAWGESVPVQLETNEDMDPCVLGQVSNVGADSSAMVRAGPDWEYDTVDYVNDGDLVWVCQEEAGHYGVVYTIDPDTDCEVSSAIDQTVNYSGPCNTGWIATDWVEIIAG